MTANLAEFITLIEPHLPSLLAKPMVMDHVKAISKILPCTEGIVLECRLNRPDPSLDLSVCLVPASASYNYFTASPDKPYSLPPLVYHHPLWSQLRALFNACAGENTFLKEAVSNLWLEFDINGTQTAVPIPGFFIDIHDVDLVQRSQSMPERAATKLKLAEESFRIALGREMPTMYRQNLQRCLELLPPNTVVAYFGNMLSRQSDVIRFAVRGLSPSQLRVYLQAVDWQGDAKQLLQYVDGVANIADQIVFNFEVGHTFSSRVDIECLIKPYRSAYWSELLTFFVETDYCTEEKRQALLAWPGYSHKNNCQSVWPASFNTADSFFAGAYQPVFQRTINHLKLIYRPQQPIETKAYLCLQQQWLDLTNKRKMSQPSYSNA